MIRPIDIVRDRLEGVHGSTARCPAHDDQHNSLSFGEGHDGRVVLHCHAGCAPEDVVQSLGLKMKDLFPDERSRANTGRSSPLHVSDLAQAKQLPAGFLKELGLKHIRAGVLIQYRLEDGSEAPRHRLRTALRAKDGSYWTNKGAGDILPYGLWKLAEIRDEGFLIFVEGESDCWTLWHHGFPAIGLPGASTADKLEARHVAGVSKVYICVEPDKGGGTFLRGILERLADLKWPGELFAIPFPSKRLKDPNALHKEAPAEFPESFRALMRTAVLLPQYGAGLPLTPHFMQALRLVRIGEAKRVWDNLDAFAQLSRSQLGRIKDELKDSLGSQINLNTFTAAVGDAKRKLRRRQLEQGRKVLIELGGRDSNEVVDEAMAALESYNKPQRLFMRGGRPVHVLTDERDNPRIEVLSDALLDDHLSRAARFIRTSKSGISVEDIPKRYVNRMLARSDLPFPALEGVVQAPIVRPDGRILDQAGYDQATRLLYRPPADLRLPAIPDEPTAADVDLARTLLEEMVCDFPFIDQASRANFFALLLTPAVRYMLDEACVPMACADAPTRGTGKTLLIDCVARIFTGRNAETMSAPETDDEWRKQITAQLLKGSQLISVDNVRGILQSTALEQAITSSYWSDRVLGKSEQIVLPQQATWIATGNNIAPGGDMVRRVYMIRMDAQQARPWQGRTFRHPDLLGWVKTRRGDLLAALLTLIRAWHVAGRPAPSVEAVGGFEAWSTAVGGILEHAGISGFLANLEDTYNTIDTEEAEWAELLEAIHAHKGDEAFLVKDLAGDIEDAFNRNPDLPANPEVLAIIDALPDKVQEALARRKKINRTLGMYFQNRRNRRFGPSGWHLSDAGIQKRAVLWKVIRGESGESSESKSDIFTHRDTHLNGNRGVYAGKNGQNLHSPDSPDSPGRVVRVPDGREGMLASGEEGGRVPVELDGSTEWFRRDQLREVF